MEIKKMKLAALNPAQYNPRKELRPGDAAYEKLKSSIIAFGNVEPIVWNERTGNIVGGHQRYNVLKSLGDDESEVSVVNLSETEEKQLNIALNKITGEWDEEKLTIVLSDIMAAGADLTITGFDELELSLLIVEDSDETVDDDFDIEEELVKPSVTKSGDIWSIGRHRLMCGDSTKQECIDALMDGKLADMVFTDPPWNVSYGTSIHPTYKLRPIMNDSMSTEEFKSFMMKAFECMRKASKNGAMTYVVMSAQEWGNLMLTLTENGYHWSSTIIWNKDHLVISRKDYHTKYEPIWYGWKDGAARLFPLEDRTQCDVWDIKRPVKSEEHPTMKPVELVARAIMNSSAKNSLLLDLFGGSGTTMLAAEQTGRTAYLMELDPKYCDVIVSRFRQNFPDIEIERNGVLIDSESFMLNGS